jgi:hypothetical protein
VSGFPSTSVRRKASGSSRRPTCLIDHSQCEESDIRAEINNTYIVSFTNVIQRLSNRNVIFSVNKDIVVYRPVRMIGYCYFDAGCQFPRKAKASCRATSSTNHLAPASGILFFSAVSNDLNTVHPHWFPGSITIFDDGAGIAVLLQAGHPHGRTSRPRSGASRMRNAGSPRRPFCAHSHSVAARAGPKARHGVATPSPRVGPPSAAAPTTEASRLGILYRRYARFERATPESCAPRSTHRHHVFPRRNAKRL